MYVQASHVPTLAQRARHVRVQNERQAAEEEAAAAAAESGLELWPLRLFHRILLDLR